MKATIAELIAPQLPSLRLFARALTGSQSRGDAYVAAMLEALVADAGLFVRDVPPRTATYRAFLKVWGAMPINHQTEVADSDSKLAADRRIETLTPRPRQAFLLAALEDFSPGEIAVMLDITESEARDLVDRAGREIAQQIAAKVLIIEDEPLIGMDLEAIVTDIGHEVVGVAPTRTAALELARRSRPGIILADVQLADGSSGIDAVNDILKLINVPAIFITAYPERLLTGERAEPTFLITKPFRPEMVKAVMSQALFFDIRAGTSRGSQLQ
ncbi:MAG: response regulator [Hyphomicrobiaceae bacterium]|nr:response regulator [Hyphomicrobiaceae bacterium]